MNSDVQRVLILGSLGYTAYIIATCPCEAMGYCKKEQFLAVASIPFAFAVWNFVGAGGCGASK